MNNSKVLPQSSKKPTFYYFLTLLLKMAFHQVCPYPPTSKILKKVQKFLQVKKSKTPYFPTPLIPDLSHITEPKKSVANTLQQHTESV